LEIVGGAEWLRTNNVAFLVLGIARISINRRQNKTNTYFEFDNYPMQAIKNRYVKKHKQ
jgi:hypothetical protein